MRREGCGGRRGVPRWGFSMTQFKVVIALACIGSALGGCAARKAPEAPAAAPAAAQVSKPVVEVTAASLNVRETPSSTGAVVGSLKRGDRASAPEAESGGWLYVESDAGPKGYVASKYVRVVEASATAAPAPAAAATPSAPAATSAPAETAARKPATGSSLARITEGMTEAQVVEILGAPTSQQNYMTGKAWIPFYYGPDTGRLDYRYKGVGMVVFSRSRYSSATKVIRVAADPNEDGLP